MKLRGPGKARAWTLLQCIQVWKEALRSSNGTLAVMGDALGVLHDAQKFRAADPALNNIMAEIPLLLAPMGKDVQAIHLWTQRNTTCDMLSRLAERTVIPECLARVQRVKRREFVYRVIS